MRARHSMLVALAAVMLASVAAAGLAAAGPHFSAWTTEQKIDEIAGNSSELNTPSLDGCPILSPDGLSLYMASNRPGGQGWLDIWVARRTSKRQPFGAPVNLGPAINSPSDDFCPTPVRDGLFFVSRKTGAGTCGQGDIYFARYSRRHGWSEPVHLGCDPVGPNSALDEQGPSLVKAGGTQLYFSRSSAPPFPVVPATST